ncbi:HAMP domain-containing protein [bacterium]|nr:HAMP domain-containing protein [bacterium]
MKNKKLFTQIFPSFLIVVVMAVVLLGTYEFRIVKEFYTNTVISDLKIRADLISNRIKIDNLLSRTEKLQTECVELSRIAGVRITIIRPDGKVLNDSHKYPDLMDNHSDRPEIIKAFSGATGHSIRHSYTLKKELLYLAVPYYSNKKLEAVVRLAIPFSDYHQTLLKLHIRLIWGGLIILLLTGLASFWISRSISRPIENIKRSADRFANGDFSKPAGGEGPKEISSLADTLNSMAEQLDKRIRTISMQRNEQEAMFRSMQEGVLAVDPEEKIIRINKAAREYLGIKEKEVHKHPIYEIVRNRDLLDFIDRALKAKKHLEEEIPISSKSERIFLMNSAPIQDLSKESIGVIVVINDITRIKQWDKMRMEFVANVSHELKTPITSIKGYVETLLNGDVKDEETLDRFLKIILHHSDRMNAIINDLLELSKIEQQEKAGIKLERQKILPVIQSAVCFSSPLAEKKHINIEVDCAESTKGLLNSAFLEQAIINLVDNAVKYSEENSRVYINVKENNKSVVISVQDWGCGIPREHHERLFERFYRVDKGRSRDIGGTGLGLAIVKHIVYAHKGKIKVDSTPGEGTVFTISLNSA